MMALSSSFFDWYGFARSLIRAENQRTHCLFLARLYRRSPLATTISGITPRRDGRPTQAQSTYG